MFRSVRLLAGFGALLLVAACNDSGSGSPTPVGPLASLQVIHASPDAPPVNVLIDGVLAIEGLDYAQGTGEQQVPAGVHTLEIQAQTPGAPTTLLGPTSVTLNVNTDSVFVAEGAVANIVSATFSHPLALVGPTTTQVQVLHAAPTAPAMDIYLTVPGAALASSTPFGTISYQGGAGPTQIPSGQYELRATPAGATQPVLFDSGTIVLPGGSDFVLSAVQNVGPGTATVFFSVVDAYGDDSRLYDIATPSNLRVVHDSPNATPLTVITNGLATTPLVPTIAYEAFTPYMAEPAATTAFQITPAGNTSDVLINQTVGLYAGVSQTLYVVGNLANIQLFATRDYNRRYATQAKLRIIHGSPSAGLLDVYLTAPGTAIASVTPTYASMPLLADTEFQSFAAGSYTLTITPAGSKSPVIGPESVSMVNGGIYTAVASDAPGGGSPLGLILLDDL
jgi:hypothetical protein